MKYAVAISYDKMEVTPLGRGVIASDCSTTWGVGLYNKDNDLVSIDRVNTIFFVEAEDIKTARHIAIGHESVKGMRSEGYKLAVFLVAVVE